MSAVNELPIRVGIGLIGRGGRYLIRRRPEGSAMAGYWEFPGGKCEPDESPEAATARECLEEVGIGVVVGELVHQVVHRYPHGLVELNYFLCATRPVDAEPSEASGFVWVLAGDLPGYRFPEANDVVIADLAASRDSMRTGWKSPSRLLSRLLGATGRTRPVRCEPDDGGRHWSSTTSGTQSRIPDREVIPGLFLSGSLRDER